jgi:hypothetical protein
MFHIFHRSSKKSIILNGCIRFAEKQSLKSSIATEMITDERDQLIELKSMRIGFVASSIGFIIGLISLALNYSPVVMMNIVFLSFGIGSLLDGCIQLYLYRRG